MIKQKRELRWLRKDGDEWQWAQEYISKHADVAMRHDIERFARRMEGGYEQVVADISRLEQTAEGVMFVTRLKNALRQYRYRAPSHDRKLCTFSLSYATSAKLFRLSKANRVTATAVITTLIDDAEWAARKHSEREKNLKISLAVERKRSGLALETFNAQLEQTMKHLEHTIELLVMREQTMGTEHPPFDGDQEKVRLEVEKRLKQVKTMNAIIALSYALPNDD
jgi:macrodomain Ter protein organizer (MatP/YcbG family)